MSNLNTAPFLLIGITPPASVVDEHQRAFYFLEQCIDILHVRKPSFSEREMRNYLLPYCEAGLASRIVLHSHFSLAKELGLRGIHINEHVKQDPEVWHKFQCVSVAIHHLSELSMPTYQSLDYAMVSPLFPSISKEGYCPQFSLFEFQNALIAAICPVVALGGITPERIPLLRQIGCRGAAFLGYLWQTGSISDWQTTVDNLRSYKNE